MENKAEFLDFFLPIGPGIDGEAFHDYSPACPPPPEDPWEPKPPREMPECEKPENELPENQPCDPLDEEDPQ